MHKYVVTGAFGFSGKYIARRLLDQGYRVHVLTNSPGRANPFGDRVTASPFRFDDPGLLAAELDGADGHDEAVRLGPGALPIPGHALRQRTGPAQRSE